jgi:hypothetical protein
VPTCSVERWESGQGQKAEVVCGGVPSMPSLEPVPPVLLVHAYMYRLSHDRMHDEFAFSVKPVMEKGALQRASVIQNVDPTVGRISRVLP